MNETPPSLLPASILVVDDHRENLRLLANLLTQQGYTVRAIPDGRLALASVQAELPDLILLDVVMPEMDGYQVCVQLKADERTRDIPVIFISIATQVFDKVKAFSVGGVDYITKPFQGKEVLARVQTHLALRAMQTQLEEKMAQLERVNDELTREIAERKWTERALQESEGRYRSLVETSPDAITVIDLAGNVILANQRSAEMHGCKSADELLGKNAFEFIVPEDRHRAAENARQTMKLGGVRNIEYTMLRKDGSAFPTELSASALLDAAGKPIAAIGIVRDITERKRALDLLRTQRDLGVALSAAQGLEETLRLCVETAIHVSGMDCGGVYLIDQVFGSVDLAFHTGLPAEFVANASHYETDSAKAHMVMAGKPIYVSYQDISGFLDESMHFEGVRTLAVIPVSHEDRVIACLNIASHVLDEVPDFARTALETIATQIGSAILRSEAEDALQQSQADLQILFDSLEDFLFVLDMEGCIMDCNPVVLERLGYAKAELLGESVLKVHPPDRHEETMAIVADMVVGQADSCPVPLMTREGSLIPVETKIARGRWGGRQALFGTSRDITERQQAAEAIQQLYEQTRRDAEAKATLLREVNHRVKNNLTSIIGLIDTEQRYASTEGHMAIQAAMERLVQRIDGLAQVHDILSQSEWSPVSLSDLVEHIVSTALNALPLDRAVFVDVTPSEVKVSPRQASNLALIVNELVTNTAKHAVSRHVATHVAVRIALEDDGAVLLEYRDDGIGYPEEVLRLEQHGVGLYLIQILVHHALSGSLTLLNDGGAVTAVQFKAIEGITT